MVAELVISPQKDRSRHYFTLLYNQINSQWEEHDYETVTAGTTYLVARNIRLTLEYTRNVDMRTDRGVIGLVTAFSTTPRPMRQSKPVGRITSHPPGPCHPNRRPRA